MYICPICQDGLDNAPLGVPGTEHERIITTSCGHIYHLPCINNWWRVIVQQHQERNYEHAIRYSCPSCRTFQLKPLVFELFPSSVEGGDGDAGRDTVDEEIYTRPLRAKLEELESIIQAKDDEIVKLRAQIVQGLLKGVKLDPQSDGSTSSDLEPSTSL